MSTLLLRLAGPLQSWGSSSKYNVRTTERAPTKSGVIGLVASALGRGRDCELDDLTELAFGVRIDQEGVQMKDFHTAHHITNEKLAFISDRMYLADALFLVGLEGEKAKLEEIDAALKSPAYPLFLGRRSCPPAGQISLGIRDKSLFEALREEKWLAAQWYRGRAMPMVNLEIICDSKLESASVMIRDMPVSYSQERRKYAFRGVSHHLDGKVIENNDSRKWVEKTTDHDAIAELTKEVR